LRTSTTDVAVSGAISKNARWLHAIADPTKMYGSQFACDEAVRTHRHPRDELQTRLRPCVATCCTAGRAAAAATTTAHAHCDAATPRLAAHV
jgi:hypothetical protein